MCGSGGEKAAVRGGGGRSRVRRPGRVDVDRGGHSGQSTQELPPERIAAVMQENKRAYANYYERFAWAPCDMTEMMPDEELFWSGQTQYPGSVSGLKAEIAAAHRLGIKAITYGKSCGAGIAGAETFRRFPQVFWHSPATGTASESLSAFYLERMSRGEYTIAAGPGVPSMWQHWASFWARPTPEAAADVLAFAVLPKLTDRQAAGLRRSLAAAVRRELRLLAAP
jgi:hypothetical protein